MKIRKYFFVILIFVTALSFAQKKKLSPQDHFPGEIIKNFKGLSISKRLEKYPFNNSSKIKLISYNLNLRDTVIITQVGDPDPIIKKSTSMIEILSSQSIKSADQNITLSLQDIITLSDILYNECNKYYIGEYSTKGCYYPRNAILFYDNNDEIFAYFEICFECQKITTKPKPLDEFEEYCNRGYKPLEDFFNKKGIKTKYKNH